ncbi:glycosyltransferase family 52 [Vibrio sp. CAU 1672]|uniref:glycosyltransferase family 52 n=1 Tax=Vibrio sp. CAU 1672 TaxID=3032594 RepID=UPI0023DB070F|nr:glycosyltransferase family 52 [Vibrio sp. CAU 1672]MDF2153916.1 glycosyltransferase family 52 [Vibrio sp. CAU 1672]
MKNIITYKRVTSDYNNVCYVNSIFALFLYLYINKGDKNTLFVSHVDFEGLLKESRLDNVIIVDTKRNRNWDSLLHKFGLLKYDLTEFIQGKLFFGHDHLTFAFLFDFDNASVLEDGTGNYGGPIALKKRIRRALKGRVVSPLGYGKQVKTVYLSKPEQADRRLQKKVAAFSVVDLLDYTRNHSLKKVLTHDHQSLSNQNILFTQPISDLITEEGKIKLYQQIVDEYQISVIKPHPRETTDYAAHFSCEVLDKFIPAEALIAPDDQNINLYTLSSTSVLNLKEVNNNLHIELLAPDLHNYLSQWQARNHK